VYRLGACAVSGSFFDLGKLRLLRLDCNAEHGEERIARLGAEFLGSPGSYWEPERAENGEAANGSKFQGHRDLLFKTVEEVMPESCIWRCDVCHNPVAARVR
jgi:hypothetical protein